MRKIAFILLVTVSVGVYAFENGFLGKFTIEKSSVNTKEKIEAISVVNDNLVLIRSGRVFITKFSGNNDVKISEERADLEKFGIEGQFSEYKNVVYFSSNGVLYSVSMMNGIWNVPQELTIQGYEKKHQMGRGSSLFYGKWRYKTKGIQKEKMYNPCIANRGKRIYFSSVMAGGMGGKDLWYMDLQPDGVTWSQPVNIPGVNSAGDEDFPFVDVDNVLYYASDKAFKKKGYNIYKKYIDSSDQGTALDNQFNTDSRDYNFVIVGGVPFFLSDRQGVGQLYFTKSKKEEE